MSGQCELRSKTLPHSNKDGFCFRGSLPGVNSKLQRTQATCVLSNLALARQVQAGRKLRQVAREAASKSVFDWLLSF